MSEISLALKKTLETTYGRVRVKGEISGVKHHTSGHLYFALKDDQALLDAVCWRGGVSKLSFVPTNGLGVVCQGRITSYPGRSRYQIVVDDLSLTGEGTLLKLLEQRKQKLREEGLFDLSRKKPLPFFPNIIGIITSPTGAVIQDILHRLEDRLPRWVYLWPVTVQGETAATEVAAALEGFNRFSAMGFCAPDVLIVARGGGSFEDLLAFNEEIVVRAVAASRIPVISAVGHETDTPLIDYVADFRAPTPSAAAEVVVPVRRDLLSRLLVFQQRIEARVQRILQEKGLHLALLKKRLPSMDRFFEPHIQRLDDLGERLIQVKDKKFLFWESLTQKLGASLKPPQAKLDISTLSLQGKSQQLARSFEHFYEIAQSRLKHLEKLLENVSYMRTLERGFCLATTPQGELLTSARDVETGDVVHVHFSDGPIKTSVI